MEQDCFPKDLLQRPVEDRIAYFKGYTMAHPNLLETVQRLMDCIKNNEAPLVFIYGPPGVGKSTLLRRVSQRFLEALLTEVEEDRNRIPIAGIEAMAPEFSQFEWRDFYWRALQALKAPYFGSSIVTCRDTKFKLRTALETALHYRRPDVFYVDEAQNLGKVGSGRRLQDQTDCIKSLANICNVQFVLVGTYELLMLRNLSAQLCRRSVDIHFSRYRAESPQDLKIFRSIVQTFQRHLPLNEEPNLVEHWDFCYERSVGCTGILKDWFSRTLAGSLKQNNSIQTITLKQLEKYAPSLKKSLITITEIKQQEAQLEPKRARADLRIALGLDLHPDSDSETSTANNSIKTQKQRTAVGKPLPKRRPIGKEQDAG